MTRNQSRANSFHQLDTQENGILGFAKKQLMLLAIAELIGFGQVNAVASNDMGITALHDLGCGACHDVPGVSWPKSNVGPPLLYYGDRSLIAGITPNTHDNLAAFIQNAPRFVPEGAMPSITMTEQQAQDIATYLLSLRERQ